MSWDALPGLEAALLLAGVMLAGLWELRSVRRLQAKRGERGRSEPIRDNRLP